MCGNKYLIHAHLQLRLGCLMAFMPLFWVGTFIIIVTLEGRARKSMAFV
jgi:hypothetical protein